MSNSGTIDLLDGVQAHQFAAASISIDSTDVAEAIEKYALATGKLPGVLVISVRPTLDEMVAEADKFAVIGPAVLWLYGVLVLLQQRGIEIAVFYLERAGVPVTQR
jgi:hypothetical protein